MIPSISMTLYEGELITEKLKVILDSGILSSQPKMEKLAKTVLGDFEIQVENAKSVRYTFSVSVGIIIDLRHIVYLGQISKFYEESLNVFE